MIKILLAVLRVIPAILRLLDPRPPSKTRYTNRTERSARDSFTRSGEEPTNGDGTKRKP